LRGRLFGALWVAGFLSSVGSQLQEVGSGWLMTRLAPDPLMVSLVQAAGALPIFLLALPAGAVGDLVDRRRYLIVTQLWMAGVALAMGLLTVQGEMTPLRLLLCEVLLNIGVALNSPVWHSIPAEVVPADQLRAATALNGITINLARAVGPALGGVLIVALGTGATFLLNVTSFLPVVVVLLLWRRPRRKTRVPGERFLSALRTGLQHVRYAPSLHGVLGTALLFVSGSTALWALLPLYVEGYLGGTARLYGVCMTLLGLGSVVAGGWVLPWLRNRVSLSTQVALGCALFGGCQIAAVSSRHPGLACAAMFAAGVAWMLVLTNLHYCAQAMVPDWVRSRVLGIYMLTFFFSVFAGSTCWGAVAGQLGVPQTFLVAGVFLIVASVLPASQELAPQKQEPAGYWPEPVVAKPTPPGVGPVLVTVDYTIEAEKAVAFRQAMREVRLLRFQNGVLNWGLFVDMADPTQYREVYLEESWAAHLRQHERVTHQDQLLTEAACSCQSDDVGPAVVHWLDAQAYAEEVED